MMSMKRYHPTSVKLTDEAREALRILKERPGGFNLNGLINQLLVKLREDEQERKDGKEKGEERGSYSEDGERPV